VQTFLPSPDFDESARVLDRQRLGNQRSEAAVLLKTLTGLYALEGRKGWPNHPATKMWDGYELALCEYSMAICREWRKRGYKDKGLPWCMAVYEKLIAGGALPLLPWWLGDLDFHVSHQSNLLRKVPDHYRQFWPDVPDDLPYIWPVK